MTTDEAKTILSSAAAAHDRETDALWEQVMKNFFVLRPAGYEAAHKKIRVICNQCIEHTCAQADAEEMAEALRDEIKTRADAHEHVQTSSPLIPSEVIEASYIWCRGETGEVTMDTELSFGQYEGKTIRWLFENARDYANWIVAEMVANRPHLATFIAIEEDRRRKEGGWISRLLSRRRVHHLEVLTFIFSPHQRSYNHIDSWKILSSRPPQNPTTTTPSRYASLG